MTPFRISYLRAVVDVYAPALKVLAVEDGPGQVQPDPVGGYLQQGPVNGGAADALLAPRPCQAPGVPLRLKR